MKNNPPPKPRNDPPPEIKFRNFWCYQLKPEVELEKSSLPEMKNESDTFLGQIEGLMIRGITSDYQIEVITYHSLKIKPCGCREPPRMVRGKLSRMVTVNALNLIQFDDFVFCQGTYFVRFENIMSDYDFVIH